MPAQLFSTTAGQFIDVSDEPDRPGKSPGSARGLAVGDIDNDGRPDVVIVSENDPLALLHNQPAFRHHFLTLLLEGLARIATPSAPVWP